MCRTAGSADTRVRRYGRGGKSGRASPRPELGAGWLQAGIGADTPRTPSQTKRDELLLAGLH